MTMAYRITIKLTKTDTNPWWFLSTTDANIVQKVFLAKELGLDLVNDFVLTSTSATFMRDFDNKISANQFIIKLLTMPTMMEESKIFHPDGWQEEITTEEI
jgi:hypothetical protein